jgi:hypothetical protein
MEILITAAGHKNVMAKHRTTIEITKECHLTPAGDCIVAVAASKGFLDITEDEKEVLRRGRVTVEISCGTSSWSVSGRGSPSLEMTHPTDMVIRKSAYCCPRTLMIHADSAACDMPKELVAALAVQDAPVTVTIRATDPRDSTRARQNTRSESPQDIGRDGGRA